MKAFEKFVVVSQKNQSTNDTVHARKWVIMHKYLLI